MEIGEHVKMLIVSGFLIGLGVALSCYVSGLTVGLFRYIAWRGK